MDSQWLGSLSFNEGLEKQHYYFNRAKSESQSFVLGLEHPKVISLGIRAKESEDLLSEDLRGFEVVKTDRGGQAIIHNPGQLVIYPIIPLRSLGIGVRSFIHLLEETTIQALALLGVSSRRKIEEPGLITEKGKIAAFGIRVKNSVSYHGLSINVCNDLDCFSLIRSCGVSGQSQDRVSEYSSHITPQSLFSLWVELFESYLPSKDLEFIAPDTEGLVVQPIKESEGDLATHPSLGSTDSESV